MTLDMALVPVKVPFVSTSPSANSEKKTSKVNFQTRQLSWRELCKRIHKTHKHVPKPEAGKKICRHADTTALEGRRSAMLNVLNSGYVGRPKPLKLAEMKF